MSGSGHASSRRSYDQFAVATIDETNGSRLFTATYHDTEDRRLSRAGITLRRRMENGRSVWELGVGGASRHADGGPAGPPEEIARLLSAPLLGRELVEIARTRTRSSGGDVETALLEGHRVIDVVSDWGPKLPKPKRVPCPKTGAPALDRLRAYLREQVDAIAGQDPVARLGEDPEAVHQLRVAARRARSALRTARPLLDPDWAEGLRTELKWLGGELSPARDLDVLIAGIRTDLEELGKPAAPILKHLEGERRRAQKRVLSVLASPRYLALLGELDRAAEAPRIRAVNTSLRKLAKRDFKRLRRSMRALGREPTDAAVHDLRKRGKRARYAAELAGGKRARQLVTAAKSFQDVVGDHQDAVVAEERLTAFVPTAKSAEAVFAAGRLLERQQARRRAARRSLPNAWQKLERRGDKLWA